MKSKSGFAFRGADGQSNAMDLRSFNQQETFSDDRYQLRESNIDEADYLQPPVSARPTDIDGNTVFSQSNKDGFFPNKGPINLEDDHNTIDEHGEKNKELQIEAQPKDACHSVDVMAGNTN